MASRAFFMLAAANTVTFSAAWAGTAAKEAAIQKDVAAAMVLKKLRRKSLMVCYPRFEIFL
ncbi:hypothetical protein D3C87_1817520 [compost metagenome]